VTRQLLPPLLLLLLLFAAPAAADDEGRLEGAVFDAPNGLPLAGVTVQVGELAAVTDFFGAFSLQAPAGSWPVRVDGIAVGEVPIVAGQTTELLLRLEPGGPAEALSLEVPVAAATGSERPPEEGTVLRGELDGSLRDEETGEPVADGRIFVRGYPVEAISDEGGGFVLWLSPGEHELSILRTGYKTRAVTVQVRAGEATPLALQLTPAVRALEPFTVAAPAIEGSTAMLLDERRNSSNVADVLGAEAMSRSGDGSAGAALARVTGITLVDGKYVYVRGMGERYSATLLNGTRLPSPEPERRVVPLDLFPTSILDSIVVQKTYSPDMAGDFGGGVVQLRTKELPTEFTAGVSVKGAYRFQTSFNEGLSGQGGPTDWLGIDGGYRALPGEVAEASAESPLEEAGMFSTDGYTADELEALGEAMPNRWNTRTRRLPPDWGAGFHVGHGGEIPGVGKLGVLLGADYGNGWSIQRFHRSYHPPDLNADVGSGHQYDFDETTNEVDGGGILTAGGDLFEDTQEIRSTTVLTRLTDNETRTYQGYNRDLDNDLRITRHRWVERMLFSQLVDGTHRIPPLAGLTLHWGYAYSRATRLEPDRRETRYDRIPDTDEWMLSDRPEGNQRVFSDLLDRTHDFRVDVTMPFAQWSGLEAKVTAGFSLFDKQRLVDTRRFKFMHKGPLSRNDSLLDDPETVFGADRIGSDGFQFEEITRQTDNYSASQQVRAFYAMIDFPFVEGVSVLGGVRVENNRQQTNTFELFNPDSEPVVAELHGTDVLPAVTATFSPKEEIKLRFGYSRTLSRPDFRE